ncbi:MAG: TrkA-C domain protein [Methanomassiliicoccales archaeon PtaU1.Bin124]|nr:MAG: TrkA-C domain protein [Methanomassiliicoccales archaeon PtaU1.Bin124]
MDELEDMLLELKDTSELMIDLAYSSLLYNNKEIAEEVQLMEETLDDLANRIQREAIARAVKDGDADKAFILVKMAASVEEISDAAMQIADVVLRGVEPHPVISLSIRDADSSISRAQVQDGSDLAGHTLGELKLASQTGMWVVAIKRDRRYIYGPDADTKLLPGDLLMVRGPTDGEEYFKDVASGTEKLVLN